MIQDNLIIGKNSKFGQELIKVLPGNYLSKQDLDLRNFDITPYNAKYNNLIILAKGNSDSITSAGKFVDGIISILDSLEYNTAWLFTSGMGTYQGSKNNDLVYYSAEKCLINFVAYKRNFTKKNIVLIQPGRMDLPDEYQARVKLFLKLLETPPIKNLIWDLSNSKYIPY